MKQPLENIFKAFFEPHLCMDGERHCTIAIRVGQPLPPLFKLDKSFLSIKSFYRLFVYDPNTSKNEWKKFQVFFIIKNWQKKYKNLDRLVCSKQDWFKKIIRKIEELCF